MCLSFIFFAANFTDVVVFLCVCMFCQIGIGPLMSRCRDHLPGIQLRNFFAALLILEIFIAAANIICFGARFRTSGSHAWDKNTFMDMGCRCYRDCHGGKGNAVLCGCRGNRQVGRGFIYVHGEQPCRRNGGALLLISGYAPVYSFIGAVDTGDIGGKLQLIPCLDR